MANIDRTAVDRIFAAQAAIAPTAAAREAPAIAARLAPGSVLWAEVQDLFADGTARIAVSGQSYSVRLPVEAAAGDVLPLRFLGDQPRPAFALARDALPRPAPDAGLSPGAKLVAELLPRPGADDARTQVRAAVVHPVPLLPAAPDDAADLAHRLQQAISRSGLFYESHQAEWVAGGRPLSALREEPQGRIPVAPPQATAVETSAPGVPGGPLQPPAQAHSHPPAQAPIRSFADAAPEAAGGEPPDGPTGTSAASNPRPVSEASPAHPSTLLLVRGQIETLETRAVVWQGEAWPGQPVHVEIEDATDRQQRRPERGDADAHPWQSTLRVALPGLGSIDARIRVNGTHVGIDLVAANASTVGRLRQDATTLRTALEARGLALERFGVDNVAAS